jgi:hypothetical protein
VPSLATAGWRTGAMVPSGGLLCLSCVVCRMASACWKCC